MALEMRAFVDAKRAIGRRYENEEKQLRLLDVFLLAHDVASAADVTPAVIEAFLSSRPRVRPAATTRCSASFVCSLTGWCGRSVSIARPCARTPAV